MGIRAPLTANLALLAGMTAFSAWAWNLIPDSARLAVHFDLAGKADVFASKPFALTAMPVAALALMAVFAFIGTRKTRDGQFVSHMPAFTVGWIGSLLLLALCHIGIVMLARGVLVNVTSNVTFFVALLFAVLGNFLGKTQANDFVGVRTTWTKASDYSWQKTNRVGGWLMVGIGLTVLAVLACARPGLAQKMLIGGTLLLVAVTIPLSRYYWKQDPDRVPLDK